MADYSNSNEFAHLQDVMGSLPMVKRYINLCLCFESVESMTDVCSIENVLEQAFFRLAEAFPYLKGQVSFEGRNGVHSGVLKIVPLADTIELVVSNLRQRPDLPSMAELEKQGYPFRYFEPDDFVPAIASAWQTNESRPIAPVMLLQAMLTREDCCCCSQRAITW